MRNGGENEKQEDVGQKIHQSGELTGVVELIFEVVLAMLVF